MSNPTVTAKGSAERALFVLATLARLGRGASIEELIELTGLAQSTLYRQLALLRRWGFVIGRQKEFSPGPLCVPLAWGFDQTSFLTSAAHDKMQELSLASGESIGLMVAVGQQIICLDMVESHQPLRCSFVKGRVLPLYRGATAKALLAFMHPGQRQAAIKHLQTGGQPLDASTLVAFTRQLDDIRVAGYAASNGEVDTGIWGASAPLYQTRGADAMAVITLMAPSSRAHGQEKRLIDMTVRGAAQISSRLQSL